jgi:hypothetical protein
MAVVSLSGAIGLSHAVRLAHGVDDQHYTAAVAQKVEPLFVLIEYNPWLMVIGSDSPTFALYDDGTLIYWKKEGRSGKYLSTRLSSEQVARLVSGINQREFESLGDRYEPAGGITDQPEYLMILRKKGGTYKSVSIYGRIDVVETRVNSKALPPALVAAFRYVNAYDSPQAQEWLPDFIEVMIWPYEYAPEKNLDWPKDFPGLQDARTVQPGDSYTLFIEKSRFTELKEFLSKMGQRQAVQIGGKKWAIAIRFPFPEEDVWARIRSGH